MKEDCTELFLRYREIARLVWNLGFWPDPELRAVPCLFAYDEAMARLFEGMVLLRLGYEDRATSWPGGLGEPVKFTATPRTAGTELWVDPNPTVGPSHSWGDPILRLGLGSAEFRFVSLFDWDKLAPRNYRWLQVLIERLDERPEFVGHSALVEFDKCSIWFDEKDQREML